MGEQTEFTDVKCIDGSLAVYPSHHRFVDLSNLQFRVKGLRMDDEGHKDLTGFQFKIFTLAFVTSFDEVRCGHLFCPSTQGLIGGCVFHYVYLNRLLLTPGSVQVLMLDSDNLPLVDPTYLFASKEYSGSGSLFFPDWWDISGWVKEEAYTSFGLEVPWRNTSMLCAESGQLLLNRCGLCAWPPLQYGLDGSQH